MILVDISHQQKIYDAGVFAFGIVVEKIGALEIAEPGDDAVNHLIDAHNFADHGFEFWEQWMFLIGLVKDLTTAFI